MSQRSLLLAVGHTRGVSLFGGYGRDHAIRWADVVDVAVRSAARLHLAAAFA